MSEKNKERRERQTPMRGAGPHFRRQLIVGILTMHVGIAISWAIAYEVTGWIYRRWLPDSLHSLLHQYLTVLLSMTILFLSFYLIRKIFAARGGHVNVFLLMIEAMQRLSKGDFNVALHHPRNLGQFEPLVTSFNQMATQLGQMEQLRQQFISNVSHEIQSPLTSITGFAHALRGGGLSEEMRDHYLSIIETECARLSKLSDNLLKLTSLESQQHPFERRAYRLDRQLRRVVLSCEPLWQTKSLELDVELPETTVFADEELLDQVWINLLANSIKFTPPGGTIRLRLDVRDDRAVITVTDTGPGIPEDALPHVFERFFKADKARSREGGGSGLGLSIVRHILSMHGGEATAANAPGDGAVFTVKLPLREASG